MRADLEYDDLDYTADTCRVNRCGVRS